MWVRFASSILLLAAGCAEGSPVEEAPPSGPSRLEPWTLVVTEDAVIEDAPFEPPDNWRCAVSWSGMDMRATCGGRRPREVPPHHRAAILAAVEEVDWGAAEPPAGPPDDEGGGWSTSTLRWASYVMRADPPGVVRAVRAMHREIADLGASCELPEDCFSARCLGGVCAAREPIPSATPPQDLSPTDVTIGPTMVSIMTSPWSRVRLDGIDLGATPVVRHELEPGLHTIILTYDDNSTEELSIRVAAGEHLRISGPPR